MCERFIGSLRRECLDFLLILSERHLLQQLEAYVLYFNQARPHQGLAQRMPAPLVATDTTALAGAVVGLPVLGGLHHDYQRRAA